MRESIEVKVQQYQARRPVARLTRVSRDGVFSQVENFQATAECAAGYEGSATVKARICRMPSVFPRVSLAVASAIQC